jgi:LysR family transcriptional regulator, nitrogen assimilation regulatory protein
MNLRQLECFVRVVEVGSMTRAAEILHLAQPALGAHIKRLEAELGLPLLVRHSRGVEPTKAGRKLHSHAVAIANLVAEARQDIMQLAGKAPKPLRLGMTPSLMQIIGPEIAVRAAEYRTEPTLALSEGMSHILVDSLRREEVDLILAYEVPDSNGFWRRPLYREDLVFVIAANGEASIPITFADVLNEVLILPEMQDSIRALIEKTARTIGQQVQVGQEMRSISGIKAMIRRGSGAGVLPFGTIMGDVREGLLSYRRIERPALRRTLYLAGAARTETAPSLPNLLTIINRSVLLLAETMGNLGQTLSPETS